MYPPRVVLTDLSKARPLSIAAGVMAVDAYVGDGLPAPNSGYTTGCSATVVTDIQQPWGEILIAKNSLAQTDSLPVYTPDAFKSTHTRVKKHKRRCFMMHRPEHTHHKLTPSTCTSATCYTDTSLPRTAAHSTYTNGTPAYTYVTGRNTSDAPKHIKHAERCTKGKRSAHAPAHKYVAWPLY